MNRYVVMLTVCLIGCSSSNGQSTPNINSDAGPNQDPKTDVDSGADTSNKLECSSGYYECGSQCIPNGNTCCASVGHPELSCPNGGICTTEGICTGNCAVNSNLTCTGGSTPYSCTGSWVPKNLDVSLDCSPPSVGIGSTVYCCVKQCLPPKGQYQFTFTTVSGNCGAIASIVFTYDGSSNLLAVALSANLSPSNAVFTPISSNISKDACAGSSTAIFANNGGATVYSGLDSVSITSNIDGSSFSGTTTISEKDGFGALICSGAYSFTATRIGN